MFREIFIALDGYYHKHSGSSCSYFRLPLNKLCIRLQGLSLPKVAPYPHSQCRIMEIRGVPARITMPVALADGYLRLVGPSLATDYFGRSAETEVFPLKVKLITQILRLISGHCLIRCVLS